MNGSANRHVTQMKSLYLNALLGSFLVLAILANAGCGKVQQKLGTSKLTSKGDELSRRSNLSSDEKADVYFALGRSAEKQGNLQEAMRLYSATLEKDKKFGDAHWRMAVCLDKSGNFQKSAVHYHEAVKLMPGNPEIFCDYGYSLALQNKWSDSEMNLRQSIAIQPELQRAHNNLGLVLAQGSKLEDARREFQLGGLSLPESHWNLAQMLVSQSRWEEARSEFNSVKTLTPDDPNVAKELVSLNRLVAKVESIRKVAEKDTSLVRVSTDSVKIK